jgi:BirA family biotin operon repressor/biotin-[acetyl-CoA-carboxylase] ligase
LSASRQFQLSKIASLAVCDILVMEDVDPMIKWPNDILTRRGKIAGILIEHGIMRGKITHTIMGIGLNLNQDSFPRFPVRATSLALEKQVSTDPGMMAERLIEKILDRYEQLKIGKGASLEQAYLERLYKLDQPAAYIAEGAELQGIIRGVNDFGELLIETKGKVRSFGHQEISMREE